MKGRLLALFSMLIASLLMATHVLAKGPPQNVTIDGPNIMVEISVTEPEQLSALGMANFENVEQPIPPPDAVHEMYLVSRNFIDEMGNAVPFDRVLYVPDLSGGLGSIYYLGIQNGSGPYDGKWYRATETGDQVFKQILKEHGVLLMSEINQPRSQGITTKEEFEATKQDTSPNSQGTWLFGLIAALFLVGLFVQVNQSRKTTNPAESYSVPNYDGNQTDAHQSS